MRSSRGQVVVLLLAVVMASGIGCQNESATPTFRVTRRDFVHRVTAQGNLKARTATPVMVPREVKRAARVTWLAEDGIEVRAGDVVARFDRTEMERRLADGSIELETSGFKIGQAKVEGEARAAEIETNREVAILELDVAQRFQKTDAGIFSRVEIVESQIDGELAGHRKENANQMQGLQETLSKTRLEILEIEKRKAQIGIQQAEEGLQALEVRAPHGGILTWTRDWRGEPPQVGNQVWPGHAMGEIPDLSLMEAEVYVLEADAGGLAPGRVAEVTVEAHPETTYPATIARVEPVAKRRFRGSPVQYFGVILSFKATNSELMKPGQRILARLFLEERPDTLVVPRQALFSHNGGHQVYVRTASGFASREVTVAALSTSSVAIEAGLREGEVVALEAPGDQETLERPETRVTSAVGSLDG